MNGWVCAAAESNPSTVLVMTSIDRCPGSFPPPSPPRSGCRQNNLWLIVVVGAMLCTLFLNRYMMPIL